MFETIRYSVNDGIAEICLNRLEHHNAVNSVMNNELPKVWQLFHSDPKAIVAIISGAGDRAFCTGADISDLPHVNLSSSAAASASMRWTSQQNQIWKPVICAVNGMAVGGGLHFVADSDIVIAAKTATFFDTHVKVGLVSALEPIALARRMPMESVLRMALTGGNERMTAEQALAKGLVGEVVAQDDLLKRTREIAAMLVGNSPNAMARTKKAIWSAKQLGLEQALAKGWDLIIEHNQTADFIEGTQSFLERRSPNWQAYQPD